MFKKMKESKEDIVINLRSMLLSCKGGLPINRINDEYKEIFGTSFPLLDLGYHNLHEFFASHPEDFLFIGDNVLPVAKTASAHIGALVNNQKTGKKQLSKNNLCDHCKNIINTEIKTPEITHHRRIKRRRRQRRSKLPTADVLNSIGPKMNTYNPNGWKYAITVFKDFINSAKKNKMEVEEDDRKEDFTVDIISGIDDGSYISFEN